MKLGRKRERVLQRLGKTFRDVAVFDADPQRGGHLQHFEQNRPDLEELAGKVSVFERGDDQDDEDDDGAADDIEGEFAAMMRERGFDPDDDDDDDE
jgi:hypothetical protein